jgi:hypothetical protein
MTPTPTLGRQKQKNCELEASLGYIERPCLNKAKRKKKNPKLSEAE